MANKKKNNKHAAQHENVETIINEEIDEQEYEQALQQEECNCENQCCENELDNQSVENEPIENDEDKITAQSLKKDIKNLQTSLESLQAINNKLQIENSNLQNQITTLNEEYIQKVTIKAKEASELVKQKQAELNARFELDVNNKIISYIEKKISPILDCIDQLRTIVNVNVENSDVKNYLFGFKMILDLFERSLEAMDIKIIPVNVGDQFNEESMTAFEIVETSEYQTNQVTTVLNPAYQYQTKIIKYASVKVQK